jgi:excisionase family DNA binding protein
LLFPTSHIRLYSHDRRERCSPTGKSVAFAQRDRCTMATHSSGDISDAKFLTVAEVAAMMRVSKMTVYRLVHGGELPAVRVGRSFRVREEDANEYLRKSFYNAG